LLLSCRSDGSGWLTGWQSPQAGDCGGDVAGPGPALREAELQAAAAVDEASGNGERAVPAKASICVQASSSQARATISH